MTLDSDLDDRWHRRAPADFVSRLLQRRANINLIRTILCSRVLADRRQGCDDVGDLAETLARLGAAPPGALAAIMATPYYDHWAYLVDNVRRRYERAEAVPDSDLPSYRNFGDGATDRVAWLLRDFGRFALKIAILSRSDMEGRCLVWDDQVTLGLWGVALRVSGPLQVRWCVHNAQGKLVLHLGKREFDVTTLSAGDVGPLSATDGVMVAPRLRRGSSEIHFSMQDPLVRREWVEMYVNPDGTRYLPPPADLTSFRASYEDGLRLLEQYWPSMASDIVTGLHSIIPVGRPSEERGVSCSSDVFFGAILCCDNPPVLAAEVLVHEYGHNVFNEMLARDKVFESEPSKEQVLYSPWREDPRPVLGCFHGAFVFERVCQFYVRYIAAHPDDRTAVARFRLLLACIRISCSLIMTAGGFGVFGAELIEGISDRAERMAASPTARLREEDRHTIESHFADWCTRNPNLTKQNQFALPS